MYGTFQVESLFTLKLLKFCTIATLFISYFKISETQPAQTVQAISSSWPVPSHKLITANLGYVLIATLILEKVTFMLYVWIILSHVFCFQLKAVILNAGLEVLAHADVKFDSDLPEYRTTGGVSTGAAKNE